MSWLTEKDIYKYLELINVPLECDKKWVRIGDSYMLNSYYKLNRGDESRRAVLDKCFKKDSIHLLEKYILPINIKNEHWLLFVIDIPGQTIYTFNSAARNLFPRIDGDIIYSGSIKYDETERQELYKMKTFLHWYGIIHKIQDFYEKPWITVYSDYSNIQDDDWSCGYYLITNIIWQCSNQSFINRLNILNFELEYEYISNNKKNPFEMEKRFQLIENYAILDIECDNNGPMFSFVYCGKYWTIEHTNVNSKNFNGLLDQGTMMNITTMKQWNSTGTPLLCNIEIGNTSVRKCCNQLLRYDQEPIHFGIENFQQESLSNAFALLFFSLEPCFLRKNKKKIFIYIVDSRFSHLKSKKHYAHPLDLHKEHIIGQTPEALTALDELYELGRLFMNHGMVITLFSRHEEMLLYLLEKNRILSLNIANGSMIEDQQSLYCNLGLEFIILDSLLLHIYVSTAKKQDLIKIYPSQSKPDRIKKDSIRNVFIIEFQLRIHMQSKTRLSTNNWKIQ